MDLFDLSGKVAIVTGGNSGIGLGIAKGLALAGAAVNIAARDRERTNGAVAEIRRLGGTAEAVIADATDPDSVAAMTAEVTGRHGRLDILVNNVGGIIRKRPEDLTYDEWKWTLNVCIDSAFLCSRAAYPHLKAAGGGKILNNGSMASLFGLAFGAAWAKDNIQVNCYLPGFVETRQTAALPEQVPGIREKVNARCPAGRWGTGDDFAGIAVFLASRASDYITGAAIPVDGGYACAG
jgi:2-dehydro-3-deoxy-D-gluconate 5-dehydrogenase